MEQKPEAIEEKVSFYKLFNFADKLDVILMIIGFICAVANGLSQPLMALIFGKLINTFGSTDPSQIVKEVSKVFIIIIYLYITSNTHINTLVLDSFSSFACHVISCLHAN